MQAYMVVRSVKHTEKQHHRTRDSWIDDYVYLQEKDAIERAEELNKTHQQYCERYNNSLEYLEFWHVELEIKGSWVDV